MDPFTYAPVEDPLFGAIAVDLDHEAGVLRVSGADLPRTEVRRAAGAALETHVPIGTRDPAHLAMSLDDTSVPVRPAKAFLTRRSYRVDVGSTVQGVTHRLVPVSVGSSRLLKDGRPLGVLTSTGDGNVTVEWKADSAPDAYDAAVGYALAGSFGTGAEPMWKLTLDAALMMWT
ncbi:hypothetical protein ACFIN9_30980 [Streptomyces noursei]|nr:hypothetical protein DC74_2047 [Streptomyces noursei]